MLLHRASSVLNSHRVEGQYAQIPSDTRTFGTTGTTGICSWHQPLAPLAPLAARHREPLPLSGPSTSHTLICWPSRMSRVTGPSLLSRRPVTKPVPRNYRAVAAEPQVALRWHLGHSSGNTFWLALWACTPGRSVKNLSLSDRCPEKDRGGPVGQGSVTGSSTHIPKRPTTTPRCPSNTHKKEAKESSVKVKNRCGEDERPT